MDTIITEIANDEMEDAEGVVQKLEVDLIFAEDKIREYERKRNDARYRASQLQSILNEKQIAWRYII